MKILYTVSILLALAVVGISGATYSTLDVHFSVVFGGYWSMPLSVNEIVNDKSTKFAKVNHDDELNVDVYSHRGDPRFFLLFDTYGNIAGIRTGYIKSDIESAAKERGVKFDYDYTQIPMFKSGTFWNTSIWYANVLFANPDVIKSGGRKDTKGEVAEGVYVILDGEWKRIEEDECNIEKLGFVKQSCFIGMGQHYFYKLDKNADCTNLQPLFILYNNGRLLGFGLVPFGAFTHKEDGQEWFETVSRRGVQSIVPNAPECIYDWTEKYHVTSLHFFLKPRARWTLCPLWGSTKC